MTNEYDNEQGREEFHLREKFEDDTDEDFQFYTQGEMCDKKRDDNVGEGEISY